MEKTYYWSDIAELTHETQVEEFGWCSCEEQEYFPYDDCPREINAKHELIWVSCDCESDTCQKQVCLDCDDTLARECD